MALEQAFEAGAVAGLVLGWIFSQMGERRAREFVELTEEFTTYMSLCMPGKPRPTADEVKAAFSGNAQEDA